MHFKKQVFLLWKGKKHDNIKQLNRKVEGRPQNGIQIGNEELHEKS